MAESDPRGLSNTIAAAEEAIANAQHRAELVSKMLTGMGVSAFAASAIFDNDAMAPGLTQQAEKDLLHEVSRQRRAAVAANPSLGEADTKKRRPTIMRGMMI
ncbi:type III secretion protein [Shewanella sp. SR44-3]|uniref:type III secretion protein n=1 Tax=Shewanella sp. SR44-3 TaxID=2760936 RepID=UPI0015FAFDBD|nr:type III secretion protein [Shewanella sp. SR44-3]MBB1268989.1 type III secretion protein [Shewanella sp. SR44-3]